MERINTKTTNYEFYAYSWHMDEEYQDETFIRIYGFDDQNQNICVAVNGFRPFVWVELPTHIDWKYPGNKEKLYHHFRQLFPDIKCTLKFYKKLYGANLKKNKEGKYVHKMFPYLLCSFSSYKDLKFNFPSRLKTPQRIMGLGNLKFHVHGQDACPRLQLTSKYNLPTAGWIKIKGTEILKEEDKFTSCHREFLVDLRDKRYKVEEIISRSNKTTIPKPLILSFDLEVNSEDQVTIPKASKPGDVVFQISCVFSRLGSHMCDKYLLSLGDPKENIVGSKVLTFNTEKQLLMGYRDLVNQINPNVIIGYNIFNFDIPYLMDRSNHKSIYPEWSQQGFAKDRQGVQREIKWSSSAYKNQEFRFLDCEGRLYIDLLPVVQRDFKLNDYKLKTVSTHFIGETKDDLDPKSIFRCYREGIKDNSDTASKYMSICGKYCMQDSMLVIKLMEKLNIWYGLSEMAAVCNVPMITLFTKGQQIKVYSNLYKYCLENKIVPEKDGYTVSENERYVGAYVFPPVPGLYENVVSLDFNSLYPSLIISYNLDYTTCAFDPTIPDDLCHVMEWEDHIACEHDPKVTEKIKLTKTIEKLEEKNKVLQIKLKSEVKKLKIKATKNTNKETLPESLKEIYIKIDDNKTIISQSRKERSDITKSLNKNVMCEKRRYRFLKTTEEYPEFKGVLPTIVQSLLDARKDTRKEMGKLKESLKTIMDEHERHEVETTISILNQRQLAYKVSANSMYGITGVKAGLLPFMPVAMTITYMGRENILKAAEYGREKFNGKLIYIDTDCLLWSSPIIIRKENKIFYTTVDEISQGDWKRINPNKEISTPKKGYEVWSDQGFTKIENVVRCKPIESMSRVTTHVGTVVCSDNHSLLTDYLASVTPQDVEIGDYLCVAELPLPQDTPKEPLYPNRLTAENIEEYRLSDCTYSTDGWNISENLAFIWGLFMADGSCGEYEYKNQLKYSWAINKADTNLLERVRQLCQSEYKRDFQILQSIESSQSKLVQCKCDNKFVLDCRDLFYTKDKYKKIPDVILQAPFKIRQAFFMGFYAGDSKKGISITFKGQIGSAQLFYLMRSIGYQVSVNVREDKLDIYKLMGSTSLRKMRKVPNAIKKLTEYKDRGLYIYDIQTSNHHFAAGVGQLVVHNSNYFSFPDIKDHSELWDFAIKVADEISSLFPPPMKLEFEEAIYTKFLILTKKRYMYQAASRDGTIKPEIGKRGVVLNRRDNSAFIRNTYENMVKIIFENTESVAILKEKVISSLINNINSMFNHELPTDQFIITKSTGDYGNLQPQYFMNEKGLYRAMLGQYNVPFLTDEIKEQEGIISTIQESSWYLDKLPAHIQLLEKIRRRGQMRNEGSRLEYVIVETNNLKAKQSAKIETVNYFVKNKGILNLDYLYYLERLINPVDQILEVIFNLKDFTKIHHNNRILKKKLTIKLNDLFSPSLNIVKDRVYLVKIDSKYSIINGSKSVCKQTLSKIKEDNNVELVFKTDHVPRSIDLFSLMKFKYGPTTSLKTKFKFEEDFIMLDNMSESKLISTIKKECKVVNF
jgi:DNA polymerase elongation subunit (family B)